MFDKIFGEGEAFKLMQRLFGMFFISSYISLMFLSASIWALSIFFEPCSVEQICKSNQMTIVASTIAQNSTKSFGVIVTIIVSFYFGGGAAEGVINTIKSKKQ